MTAVNIVNEVVFELLNVYITSRRLHYVFCRKDPACTVSGATEVISTTESDRLSTDPRIVADASSVQDAVKAAHMVLKDVRSVFSEKAAIAKAARDAQPKLAAARKAKAKAKSAA